MASDMNDYFNKKKSEGGGFKNSNSGGSGGPGGPQMPNINFGGGKAALTYFLLLL